MGGFPSVLRRPTLSLGKRSGHMFAAYERAHPKAASRLQQLMGVSHDGTHQGRVAMVRQIPMVEMRLRPD